MDIRTVLHDFRKSSEKSEEALDQQNIALLVMFLNVGIYQRLPEDYPKQKYLDVKISFEDSPVKVEVGPIPEKLDTTVPFSQGFLLDVVEEIGVRKNLKEYTDRIGIKADVTNDQMDFSFRLDMSRCEYYFLLQTYSPLSCGFSDWKASLFVTFLCNRAFKRLIREVPYFDELDVHISFATRHWPEMQLSEFMTLKGFYMVPFTYAFVLDVAHNIQNLKGAKNDIGLNVSISEDETKFDFWIDTP